MDILVFILSLLGGLIVIGIIIMTHELGHYSIGRACKMKIDEFSVGFGPKIKSWFKNDIKYSVRWFFIGGYTKFHGEDEDSGDKLAFNNQPAGRRALSIAAGPVFNVLFALILAIFMLCVLGDEIPEISTVRPGGPAHVAGIMPGDRIVEMNGVKTEDFLIETYEARAAGNNVSMPLSVKRGNETLSFDVPYESVISVGEVLEGSAAASAGLEYGDTIIRMNGLKTEDFLKTYNAGEVDSSAVLPVIVQRFADGDYKKLSLNLTYRFFDEQTAENKLLWQESRLIGITYGKHVTYGFFEAIALSFKYIYFILKSTIASIIGLLAGKGTEGLVSLPGIVNYLGMAIRSSVQSVLQIGVAVSIGLAIANLLPLPALDGGRLVFIAIEKIFRKPVPRKVEGIIHFAGFVALMAVFLLIMYRDISRWISGG